MTGAVVTIGYQGSTPEAVFGTLRTEGVRTVIDVRAVPWSRRAAFTKTALAGAAAKAGLRYVHLAGLGNPAKTDPTGGPGMAAHLAGPEGRAALESAAALMAEDGGPVALLCLERDPMQCHRSAVAAALAARTGAAVRHLVVPRGDPRQGDLFGDG
ncbi:DUF488 domain-containing protein [Roseospira navarrensis]|uniref:DUF488 family protein n=1 Tax=Roseospira navarrensis TaxID=140058 RepID=A0A7X1ZCY5_9PROT|nr:DUF488 domain-containing protein [Roseospira navarrensis]MQX35102.1 DUF488 family protein [Roseospira navarrensis]